MPIPTTKSELVTIFGCLGAAAAESYADCELRDGIQLLRYLFLHHAWKYVVADGDSQWIDDAIDHASKRPCEPYAGLGHALARFRAAGMADDDLTEMARCLQAQMLFHVAYALEADTRFAPPLDDVAWGLFQIDEQGCPFGDRIAALHESVLETDPTRREMRPKNSP